MKNQIYFILYMLLMIAPFIGFLFIIRRDSLSKWEKKECIKNKARKIPEWNDPLMRSTKNYTSKRK